MREKATPPRVDCWCSRACLATNQKRFSNRLSKDDGSWLSFLVTVFKITTDERCRSECWIQHAHSPCRRLRPRYRRYGSRYDLVSTPYVFEPLECYLPETLA